MIDLNARLRKGPLGVRREWAAGPLKLNGRRAIRRRRYLLIVEIIVVGSLAMIVFVTTQDRRKSATSSFVSAPGESSSARSVNFIDGSSAELSSDEARVRVEEVGPRRMVTSVAVGATFRVVPNPSRTFEVRTGDVRVRVLGTTFSVHEQAAGAAKVAVAQGRVQVEWPGGTATLEAGQSGIFPPPKQVVPEAPSSDVAPDSREPAFADSSAAPSKTSAAEGMALGWRAAALKGDYDKAYLELNERGKGGVRDEPADLMLAADVARLSAHPGDAVAPLRKLCERHPGDKRAPIAAFTLGRVLLDDLGRAAEAANFFEKARTLWPVGPIAQEALARAAEAHKRARNTRRAQALAGEYLRQYPQGAYAAVMQKMLEP